MNRSRTLLLLSLVALASIAVFSGTANAAIQVGQKCALPTSGQPVIFPRTTTPSGASFVFPTDGVVTKWGINRIFQPGNSMVAAVAASRSSTEWTLLRGSAFTDVPSQVESEHPTRFSVNAGEALGSVTFNSQSSMCYTNNVPDQSDFTAGYRAIGSTFVPEGVSPATLPNIWAMLEPDVDKDGYGDETQDQCPQSAALQTACPVLAISQSLAAAKGVITVTAVASADTSLTAVASVKVPKLGSKSAATVTFASPATAFAAGQLKSIKLKLPSRVKSALKATKKSKRLKFTVTLTGSGLANTATSIRSISLPGTAK